MRVALFVLAIALLPGCGERAGPSDGSAPGAAAPGDARPVVRSLSFPAAYLVERLAGSSVDHACVLPAGQDPSSWTPDGALVAGLTDADLLVANGAGYEAWTERAALPQSRLVLSAAGLDLLTVPRTEHEHGGSGAHLHEGTNPHTWLDPDRYAAQARAVAAALMTLVPVKAPEIEARLGELTVELDGLAATWDELLGVLNEHQIAGNDVAWAYLLERAKLPFTLILLDPAAPLEAPPAEAFRAFVDAHPSPLMLWTAAPPAETLFALKGARHVVLSPLEQPDGPRFDYVAQARASQAALRIALSDG